MYYSVVHFFFFYVLLLSSKSVTKSYSQIIKCEQSTATFSYAYHFGDKKPLKWNRYDWYPSITATNSDPKSYSLDNRKWILDEASYSLHSPLVALGTEMV